MEVAHIDMVAAVDIHLEEQDEQMEVGRGQDMH